MINQTEKVESVVENKVLSYSFEQITKREGMYRTIHEGVDLGEYLFINCQNTLIVLDGFREIINHYNVFLNHCFVEVFGKVTITLQNTK